MLASVDRFFDEHQRLPRAMEYFRWRLSDDPSAPTQATLYNLFPGGWAEVLDTFRELGSSGEHTEARPTHHEQ